MISMKRIIPGLTASLFFITAFGVSQAQDSINVVTTAVPFLRISPDARAGGMGETGIATNPDINSTFWNLAKCLLMKARAASG